ncbi:prephenate dehydrogenase/arogenate dehydrogenase family protein [Mycobacterium sp.]|uniref:prephenate dehydrogenase/arogenate dehydrogenase family protein n=1 Tax=Mycobacterium sp. TaxID=1785 RepID=UPI002619D0E1|nr:prephenate dehydrogenase/arogenate dehydrogenase family protein [Mycobacterium sp.]
MFKTAILFGDGGIGKLLRAVLAGDVQSLTIVDLHPSRGGSDNASADNVCRIVADVTRPLEHRLQIRLASAELVICALPEDAIVAALPQVMAAVPTGALVVDTASVKSPLPVLWSSAGRSILSINPMFAPSLSPVGRCVLSVAAGRPGRQEEFLKLLRRKGMVVMQLADADEHDRLTAVTQAGVHAATLAYGLTLAGAGFSGEQIAELAPPPCRQQLMLLARMVGQPPEVYQDIQRSNSHAEQVRAELIENIARVGHLAIMDDLGSAIGEIAKWLGPARVPLAELCQKVYDELAAPASTKAAESAGQDL